MLPHHLYTTNTQQIHIYHGMTLANNKSYQQQATLSEHKPMPSIDTSHTKVNITQLIGHSRQYCQQYLQQQQLDSIDFAHWLAVTELAVVLVFEHQTCVAVEYMC